MLSNDDEDSTYLPAFKTRNSKRPIVDYDNCRMKKSRTVGDLSSLLLCHDDVRSSGHLDDNYKVLVGDCLDSLSFFIQTPVQDVNMDLIQQFVFLKMSSQNPINCSSSSHSFSRTDLQLDLPKEIELEEYEDEPPSI